MQEASQGFNSISHWVTGALKETVLNIKVSGGPCSVPCLDDHGLLTSKQSDLLLLSTHTQDPLELNEENELVISSPRSSLDGGAAVLGVRVRKGVSQAFQKGAPAFH